MNEQQVREGEEMSLSEMALTLWEILSDTHGLPWSGRVTDGLQCQDKELLCSPFFKKPSLNAQHRGVYRNPASTRTLMSVPGNHSQVQLRNHFSVGLASTRCRWLPILGSDHTVITNKRPVNTCEWDPAGYRQCCGVLELFLG